MKVTEDQPRRYAEASGDHNLPHVDEGFAKMIGFRTVILQGLCTMAFAGKAIVDGICGGDPEKLSRLKARFSNVVYPGDALTTRIWQEGDGSFTFETINQDGATVLKDGAAETR
jgi:acyl dehydratase